MIQVNMVWKGLAVKLAQPDHKVQKVRLDHKVNRALLASKEKQVSVANTDFGVKPVLPDATATTVQLGQPDHKVKKVHEVTLDLSGLRGLKGFKVILDRPALKGRWVRLDR